MDSWLWVLKNIKPQMKTIHVHVIYISFEKENNEVIYKAHNSCICLAVIWK